MIVALLAVLAAPLPPAADSFPHPAHRRLFTSCTTCHAGIINGDSSGARPAAASCATCHDGRTERRVDWTPREARPSNLRFDHRAHFAAAPQPAGAAAMCRTCHAAADTGTFMDVRRATAERCQACHAHETPTHLATTNRCTSCHRPLTETRLAQATVANLPRPPSHDSAYRFAHGDDAQRATTCQVCHSRESCASCHVNAALLAPIQILGRDSRVARLVQGRRVSYRPPASHAATDFTRGHGLLARRGAEGCANCHTRESCLVCHTQPPRVPVIASMPRRERDGAPGVDLGDMRPPGHIPGFRTEHRAVAAAGDATCARCHTPSYCAACHDGASSPVFHRANFVTRHASPSLTQDNECASCHQVQVFCRDCHRKTGTVPDAATGATGRFHDRQPAWTFGHGAAARRSLESCASCHQQRFCLPCHSASGGWRVNPHGPGFSTTMGERNAAMCRVCHTQGAPGN